MLQFATLFHLIFIVFKIGALAFAYMAVTVFAILKLRDRIAWPAFQEWTARPARVIFQVFFGYMLSLWLYLFSYWGDHGLGDTARVPLGNWQAVACSDGEYTTLDLTGVLEPVKIDNEFAIAGDRLCTKSMMDKSYLVVDLETSAISRLEDEAAYRQYALRHGLPLPDHFRSFFDYYSHHWHGWRFFLLP